MIRPIRATRAVNYWFTTLRICYNSCHYDSLKIFPIQCTRDARLQATHRFSWRKYAIKIGIFYKISGVRFVYLEIFSLVNEKGCLCVEWSIASANIAEWLTTDVQYGNGLENDTEMLRCKTTAMPSRKLSFLKRERNGRSDGKTDAR